MNLSCEIIGEGPDLVLLHGWGMNAGVWSPVLEVLAEHHRLHLLELPGHGASGYALNRASLEDWTDACLDAAPDRAIWLGWSLGGLLAQQAALQAPQRVSRLVVVAGTPRFVQGADWPHAMPAETFRQFADNLVEDHAGTLERFLALQVRGAEKARDTLRRLKDTIHARPAPNERALENGLRLLLETDLRDRLQDLQCPSLWLLGERDTLVPADMSHELEALLPEAEILVLDRAAHAPFLSYPQQCLSLMHDFLEQSDGETA